MLTGADTRTSGTTTITAGRLELSGNASIASPSGVTLSGSGGTVAAFDISAISGASTTIKGLNGSGGEVYLSGKNLTIDNDTDNTYNGKICSGCGSGSLTKTGNGTLTLTGSNNLPDGTTVSNGTLQIGNGSTTGSIAGNITTTSTNANVTFNRSNNLSYMNVISGSGSLTQAGSGTLSLSNTNTYTGATTISAGGTLALVSNGAIAQSRGVVIGDSGTFDISGTASGATINGLSGVPSSTTVNLGYNALTVTQSSSSIFAGIITDGGYGGSLTKGGDGTLTLSGTNTYTGATTINGGTLNLTGTLTSAVNVADIAGATFALRGGVMGDVTLLGSNSTLNAYQGGSIDGNLNASMGGGGKLNFYLLSDIANNATLLTVTGNADITDSTVNLVRDGSSTSFSSLASGNKINLIAAGGTLTSASAYSPVTISAGITFTSYAFSIAAVGNSLVATTTVTPYVPPPPVVTPPVTPPPPPPVEPPPVEPPPVEPPVVEPPTPPIEPPPPGNGGINLNAQTKALSEAFLSGAAYLNQAQDFAATQGLTAALLASGKAEGTGPRLQGFAAIGYGKMRHNTGSHIDVDGYTLLAGLAGTQDTGAGKLTAAAFIEHGKGDYTSHNSFTNAASVRGNGDTEYTGAGVLAHLTLNPSTTAQPYLDASLRSGQVKTDFGGHFINGTTLHSAYNAKSTYVSAHVGAGYVLKLSEQSKLDVYGQYLWSHQDGDTVKLTTGETVKFKDVASQRTRLGTKWDYALTPTTTAWLGAAWEHEYDGKANASIYGYKLDAPKLKGDTGLLEIGLTLTPSAEKGWSLDVGVQGYTGKREGVTGNVKAGYRF
ncbi:membrane protein [Betaproteobacteria bacterium]|nr:membrane protein [Betaproteobacteria bacterium]